MATNQPQPESHDGDPVVHRIDVTAEPGQSVSFDVPPGTERVTINIDSSLLGQPVPSTTRRSGLLGWVVSGCAGILLAFVVLLLVINILGSL